MTPSKKFKARILIKIMKLASLQPFRRPTSYNATTVPACRSHERAEFGVEFVDEVGWFRWHEWGEWRKGYVGVSQCVAEFRGCRSAEIVFE